MPSRKKAQGKARKAAKAKKEAEGRKYEMSPLQARMAQLSIGNNEDARLMEQLWIMKNPGNKNCTHGSTQLDQRAKKFVIDFMTLHQRNICSSNNVIDNDGKYDVGKELATVHEATQKMYSDVWDDKTKMELVQSSLVAKGTQYILLGEEESDFTRCCASVAYFFEQYIEIVLRKNEAIPDTVKMCELSVADKHTLVKFFKKRIPCSCLDHVYKEVKSSTKMGLCCNNQCSHPSKQVARNTMLYCTRCRQVNYCSRECQVAHWPEHKEFCDHCVSTKDEIDSKRKS